MLDGCIFSGHYEFYGLHMQKLLNYDALGAEIQIIDIQLPLLDLHLHPRVILVVSQQLIDQIFIDMPIKCFNFLHISLNQLVPNKSLRLLKR